MIYNWHKRLSNGKRVHGYLLVASSAEAVNLPKNKWMLQLMIPLDSAWRRVKKFKFILFINATAIFFLCSPRVRSVGRTTTLNYKNKIYTYTVFVFLWPPVKGVTLILSTARDCLLCFLNRNVLQKRRQKRPQEKNYETVVSLKFGWFERIYERNSVCFTYSIFVFQWRQRAHFCLTVNLKCDFCQIRCFFLCSLCSSCHKPKKFNDL